MIKNGYIMEDDNWDKPVDIYTLDQIIMQVWQSKEDLELVVNKFDELDEDQKMNALIGLVQMIDLRCDRLYSTYNAIFHNQRAKANEGEHTVNT